MSKQSVKLTEWTTCGGCAAKWGGSPLGDLLRTIAADEVTQGLLVGLAPFDDAAVLGIAPLRLPNLTRL